MVGTFSNPLAEGSVDADVDVLIQNADLYVRKTTDNTTPLPGEQVNYIVTVSNEGQHDADNVVISDVLPVGLCYVPGSTTIITPGWLLGQPVVAGVCGLTSQTLIWSTSHNNALRTTATNLATNTSYAT